MAAAMRKPENRQQQDVVRLPNGQFRPGASGNPGGRPAALSELFPMPGESHLGGLGRAEEILRSMLEVWDSADNH